MPATSKAAATLRVTWKISEGAGTIREVTPAARGGRKRLRPALAPAKGPPTGGEAPPEGPGEIARRAPPGAGLSPSGWCPRPGAACDKPALAAAVPSAPAPLR